MVRRSAFDMMDPAERRRYQILGFVKNNLAAAGTEFSEAWLSEARPELDGLSAKEVLSGEFDPKSRQVLEVVRLARAANPPPGVSSQRA